MSPTSCRRSGRRASARPCSSGAKASGYGIVAGRRRFFALQQIAKETGTDPLVPCAVMAEGDAASAIEASIIENVARLPATEMEQYTAFRKLHDEGRTVEEIAGFFGVTELNVRRVLALAALSAPIRKLYAEEEIDRETVRALTLATPAQQADWLKLWNSETERAPMGRACRAWITGGSAITTDKALFDLAGYTGAVTADLFGETAVFADAAAFWEAQGAVIAERVEGYRQRGWVDVILMERGAYFQRWDYVQTTKKQGGKVIVEQRHDGTVTFHEGWLKAAEARKARTATVSGETAAGSRYAARDVRPDGGLYRLAPARRRAGEPDPKSGHRDAPDGGACAVRLIALERAPAFARRREGSDTFERRGRVCCRRTCHRAGGRWRPCSRPSARRSRAGAAMPIISARRSPHCWPCPMPK